MTIQEVEIVLGQYNKEYQDKWEQTRFIGFIVAISQGAKFKEPKDLLPFTWEKTEEAKPAKISPEDLERMKASMMQSVNNYVTGKTEAWKQE